MNLTDLEGKATITVPEASALLGLSTKSAYEAARLGQLPTLRLGRRVLVPVPRLLAMLTDSDAPNVLSGLVLAD